MKSIRSNVQEAREKAHLTAERHSLLANPYRVIILTVVIALSEAKWQDFKVVLEKIMGSVNPNTLSFHIKKLIEAGLVTRTGTPEAPNYIKGELPENAKADLEELKEAVQPIIKEVLKR